MIETLATGLVYRNPEPERRAIHAWHPSIVVLDDGELFASFDLASGVKTSITGPTWRAPPTAV